MVKNWLTRAAMPISLRCMSPRHTVRRPVIDTRRLGLLAAALAAAVSLSACQDRRRLPLRAGGPGDRGRPRIDAMLRQADSRR
jgi:hypothetical protein